MHPWQIRPRCQMPSTGSCTKHPAAHSSCCSFLHRPPIHKNQSSCCPFLFLSPAAVPKPSMPLPAPCSQDRIIGKKVFKLRGTIPANNYMQLPKSRSRSLGLTGHFIYIQVVAGV